MTTDELSQWRTCLASKIGRPVEGAFPIADIESVNNIKGEDGFNAIKKIFAKEILESESNEYTKMDIFILKKEMEEIKEKIDFLCVRRECY